MAATQFDHIEDWSPNETPRVFMIGGMDRGISCDRPNDDLGKCTAGA